MFLLLAYNWVPISVKMYAALILSTHLCVLMDMLGMLITQNKLFPCIFAQNVNQSDH